MSNNPFLPNGGTATNQTNMPLPNSGASSSNDNFEVDLTDVTDGYTIPDGNYRVRCIEVEQGVSKAGNPQFIWTFEVSDGDHAGFQSKVFTAITPAAMWKVAETVQALGVGQTGVVVKFKRSDVINKECGAIFEATEYNGRVNSQISKLISLKELMEANK